ncbi:MAG: AAA family ATPase [Magnetococcales bacterium]|nr:AAA family ATPase [Magnetococcales bacterium]
MHIDRMILKGFRCFGETPTTIAFTPNLTVLVGANGSGKTAAMHALLRMFGTTREQRTIQRTDFHFTPSEDPLATQDKELFIEVILAFPELTGGDHAVDTIPHVFNHMSCAGPGADPVCRIRLEAIWTNDGTPEGDIEERLYWIDTPDEVPFGEVESEQHKRKHRMAASERGLIQVHYVPATRDGTALSRNALAHMTSRLIHAIAWKTETRKTVEDLSTASQDSFAKEPGISRIEIELKAIWGRLNASAFDAHPTLSLLSKEFEEIIKRITVSFQPTEDGRDRSLDQLSDGQKSLFYLALSATVFEVEQSATQQARRGSETGFIASNLHSPALTIFALEEPENHLAPFFLSRIVKHLRKLVQSHHAMALFSSHSPGVLGRIEPEEVRHFRVAPDTRTTIVSEIELPSNDEEAAKYVREAVIAYPELYFARFVILVEGDSEQIVLPRLAEALNLSIDPSFVAVVPLGGRHVNHFWRLLLQLGIPFSTLLDLDLGRAGGGLGRIKYAANQLLAVSLVNHAELNDDCRHFLQDNAVPRFEESQLQQILGWCNWLESKGVYFSAPLDVDMMLLQAFPDQYRRVSIGERGPQPNAAPAEVVNAVFGSGGYGSDIFVTDSLKWMEPLLPWYRYRFLSKSKPAAHLQALSRISPTDLAAKTPPVLARLLGKVVNELKLGAEE